MKKIKKSLIPSEKLEIVPFRDSKSLAQFLEQPKIKIAEAITGGLELGVNGLITAGARIVQGAIKGNLMKQFGREINTLVEKGKIKEDYAETKYGFQTLKEILEFIDSESPDEERFLAVKAMFFAVNAVDVNEGEELINYQLLQIVKKLSGFQLLILKVASEARKAHPGGGPASAGGWLSDIANRMGHKLSSLVEHDEGVLMEYKLISGRRHSDRSGVAEHNFRLTDLAIKLCENLEHYETLGLGE